MRLELVGNEGQLGAGQRTGLSRGDGSWGGSCVPALGSPIASVSQRAGSPAASPAHPAETRTCTKKD